MKPDYFPASRPLGLHLPRIICLHGGGSNARIFFTQCRSLCSNLQENFRLVFADAPFLSGPGPDVDPVYKDWGPFRSWVRPIVGSIPITWSPESVNVEAIDSAISDAICADNAAGGTGPVIGLLGFSQGARLAACLLLRHQEVGKRQGIIEEYKFAVLLAGRGPLIDLGSETRCILSPMPLLRIPTIHVHGTRDQGISAHREMLSRGCMEGSAKVIEWDGNHRVAIKTKDVAPVVQAVIETAKEVGVI